MARVSSWLKAITAPNREAACGPRARNPCSTVSGIPQCRDIASPRSSYVNSSTSKAARDPSCSPDCSSAWMRA